MKVYVCGKKSGAFPAGFRILRIFAGFYFRKLGLFRNFSFRTASTGTTMAQTLR
jgi:hypothetical protein